MRTLLPGRFPLCSCTYGAHLEKIICCWHSEFRISTFALSDCRDKASSAPSSSLNSEDKCLSRIFLMLVHLNAFLSSLGLKLCHIERWQNLSDCPLVLCYQVGPDGFSVFIVLITDGALVTSDIYTGFVLLESLKRLLWLHNFAAFDTMQLPRSLGSLCSHLCVDSTLLSMVINGWSVLSALPIISQYFCFPLIVALSVELLPYIACCIAASK